MGDNKAIILAYHRIGARGMDTRGLSVSDENFSTQMALLREEYNPLSLRELACDLRSGSIERKSVAVTFDDGYADNLNAIEPLESSGIKATMFVCAGYAGGTREFWWDEIERLIISPETLPDVMDIIVDGKQYKQIIDPKEDERNNRPWRSTEGVYPAQRHRIYAELHRILKRLDYQRQWDVLTQLADWSRPPQRGTHAILSIDEIRALAECGCMEVGSHTLTHPLLAILDEREQEEEITESRRLLEKWTGKNITSFSYPYGGEDEIPQDAPKIVASSGYELAVACNHRPLTVGSDPYMMPRCMVRDWEVGEFHANLKRWFSE